jgi:6-pyruvoyltetrahydropterin/6-carboxytetrahydropterin synthase
MAKGKFRVSKTFTVQMAHQIFGEYENGKIQGHSSEITVSVEGIVDPAHGMLMNARKIKAVAKPFIDLLDDNFVNDIPELRDHAAAENIAMWLWDKVAPDLPGLAEIEIRLTGTITVSYFGREHGDKPRHDILAISGNLSRLDFGSGLR